MKILIISSTPWNNANSFGNTFSNLFLNLNDVDIYNICLKHGQTSNIVTKGICQLTDRSVLKSIYKIGFDPAWIVENQNNEEKLNAEISVRAKKKRRITSFMIRDCIWKLGRWKKSKTLNCFLKEIKPDVLYLPIYASPYICDFQSYIINLLKIPVVGHVSDDVYNIPPKTSVLEKIYRKNLRKKLRKLISKCEYLEVFAENMQKEYSEIFSKPCYLIGKGVKKQEVKNIEYEYKKSDEVKFVYTGNIGSKRYKVLENLGRVLQDKHNEQKAVLEVYSATTLSDDMKDSLTKYPCIKFMGAISREEVDVVQKGADYLVHVESFSERSIHETRMSFSTKIIDYMLVGKPILAIGPNEVNSIQVLKKNNLAIVVDSLNDIETQIEKMYYNQIDFNYLSNNVYRYLSTERNIDIIQQGIKDRLVKVLEKKNESFTN